MSQINLTALISVSVICNDVGGNFYVFQPASVLFDRLSYRKTGGGGHYLLAISEQNAIPARIWQSVRL
jgi:hypothetical protein